MPSSKISAHDLDPNMDLAKESSLQELQTELTGGETAVRPFIPTIISPVQKTISIKATNINTTNTITSSFGVILDEPPIYITHCTVHSFGGGNVLNKGKSYIDIFFDHTGTNSKRLYLADEYTNTDKIYLFGTNGWGEYQKDANYLYSTPIYPATINFFQVSTEYESLFEKPVIDEITIYGFVLGQIKLG